MKAFILLLCVLLCIAPGKVSAQKYKKIIISGTVLDVDQQPLVNAMVLIDRQKTDVMTDSKGFYKIRVKPEATLIGVVAFGNGLIEEEIHNRTMIDFTFDKLAVDLAESQENSKEEVVNTGYGEVQKKKTTTSVYKVDGTKTKRTYRDIYEMLQGVPGVTVRGTDVIIQDSRNLYGHIPPLFVVDGVPGSSIPDVHPSQIESIEVLKGTSAAIYGVRGYGGAILIKLKSYSSE